MTTRILLADDSVTIQKVVELTFSDKDYEVFTVGDGDSAITKAREVKPDVILLDVIMPGKDGYEACSILKQDEALKDTPILLLTGTFDVFDTEKSKRVGADGYIIKPFESQELIGRIRRLVGSGDDHDSHGSDEELMLPDLDFDADSDLIDFSAGGTADTLFDFTPEDIPDQGFSLRSSLEEDGGIDEKFTFGPTEKELTTTKVLHRSDTASLFGSKSPLAPKRQEKRDEEVTFEFTGKAESSKVSSPRFDVPKSQPTPANSRSASEAIDDISFEPTLAPVSRPGKASSRKKPRVVKKADREAVDALEASTERVFVELGAPHSAKHEKHEEAARPAAVSSAPPVDLQPLMEKLDGLANRLEEFGTRATATPETDLKAMLQGQMLDLQPLMERLDRMEKRLEEFGAKVAAAPKAGLDQTLEEAMPGLVERLTEKLIQPMVEALQSRLVEHLLPENGLDSREIVSAIAWHVVPDVAEMLVRRELEEIQRQG